MNVMPALLGDMSGHRINEPHDCFAMNCRAMGDELRRFRDIVFAPSVVHTYKGEGLTACGLEVVGPCPDCAEAAT